MSEFVEYLHAAFALLGPITTRRMFGGHGIYHQGLMFGLVVDATLYLKTDPVCRPLFDAEGLAPFIYIKNGKPIPMSYRRAPNAVFDDQELAQLWGRRAYEAAVRARSARRSRD